MASPKSGHTLYLLRATSALNIWLPRWYSKVKRGYANGHETVEFVERVSQFAAILETRVPDPVGSQTLSTER